MNSEVNRSVEEPKKVAGAWNGILKGLINQAKQFSVGGQYLIPMRFDRVLIVGVWWGKRIRCKHAVII